MGKEFIIKKNTTESIVVSIRIDKEIVERLDEIALKSNRSRNQIVNMALKFAVENFKLEE